MAPWSKSQPGGQPAVQLANRGSRGNLLLLAGTFRASLVVVETDVARRVAFLRLSWRSLAQAQVSLVSSVGTGSLWGRRLVRLLGLGL